MEHTILSLINQTNRNIFLTGKAGTGKTTLLRKIIDTTYKNTVVAAPTGIAALNAGGVTLHSLFQLPFASFLPTYGSVPLANELQRIENRTSLQKHFQMHKNKIQLIRNMELLIIDEVSMLRADMLDAIDFCLQQIRRNRLPFGGVQVLFIGDLLQLPPVVKQQEWEVLQQYYEGMFFFQSKVVREHPLLYIELEKIYRQTDPVFIALLNHLRENKLTEKDVAELQRYVKPHLGTKTDDNYITLTTHNAKADAINARQMEALKTPVYRYEAKIVSDFPEYMYPIDKVIELKKGARVMFIKNDPTGNRRFFNGKMGTVQSLNDERIAVLLDDADVIEVDRYQWKNVRYRLNETTKEIEEEVLGSFIQYPLRLAWAITIHKSQGLTFEKAALDIQSVFASGQAYVAFSRLRSIDGLRLLSAVPQNGIESNEEVLQYAANKATEGQVQQEWEQGRLEFLQEMALRTFDWLTLETAWLQHSSSYSGEIGNKNVYKNWAQQQYAKVKELVATAAKFSKQLDGYFRQGASVEYVCERVEKSVEYFIPLLSQVWYQVMYVLEKVYYQKKVKEFVGELEELSNNIGEEVKKLFRLQQLMALAATGKDFSKETVSTERFEALFMQIVTNVNKQMKQEQLFTKDKEEEAPKKLNTYEKTLLLWNEGKSVAQIAEERNITESTINKHLIKLIEEGSIVADLDKLFSKEEIEELSPLIDALEEDSLKIVVEQTQGRYSWDKLNLFRKVYLGKE